ncbi:MAG: N-acetyltransferase [Deltaproteobacteria bacterium]|nr:N-acetyltransferase [Nannocystaceae bacterium]
MSSPRIIETGIRDVACGEGVRIMMPSNLYGCSLGDGVFVGPFVEIQAGVAIGDRTKIQSHAFVCELVEIGDDCFVGHGVVFINDVFSGGGPAGGDRSKWRSTKICDRVSIGSNATIMPVEICDDVVIGAGAVVTHSIARPGFYVGNPARFLRRNDTRAGGST